ncbi:hypothetical protein Tco_0353074 [Tanacetum coccineum]
MATKRKAHKATRLNPATTPPHPVTDILPPLRSPSAQLPGHDQPGVFTAPKTMQEAIEMATELMDRRINTLAERQTENKRKFEDAPRNNQNQQPNKRQNTSRAYAAGNGDKKSYEGTGNGYSRKETKRKPKPSTEWKGQNQRTASLFNTTVGFKLILLDQFMLI